MFTMDKDEFIKHMNWLKENGKGTVYPAKPLEQHDHYIMILNAIFNHNHMEFDEPVYKS